MAERILLDDAGRLALKEGDRVSVCQDDGLLKDFFVGSEPWQLGHGAFVLKLKGVSGGYSLKRVTHLIRETVAAEAGQR